MTLLTIDWYVRPNRQASIVDIPTYCDVNLLLLDVVLRKVHNIHTSTAGCIVKDQKAQPSLAEIIANSNL